MTKYITIDATENGKRVESRILEERIQEALNQGHRNIEVRAYGQHGIGGRLWKAGEEKVKVKITGAPGQRLGSMGFPNTFIEVMGPASDDVGWLNAGAHIVVHGHATNGIGNAMAQGKIYVAGDIGARGMTMTKHNPRFDPPELWVLGGVGDSLAEFMAGGVVVVCGYNPLHPDNILGHRPCVGMVGGKIFFRGPHKGFSTEDARLRHIDREEWAWLKKNMKSFLKAIHRPELYDDLTKDKAEWQVLVALKPHERVAKRVSMQWFRVDVWDKELGAGGLIGDITDIDRSPIPVITTGKLRRYVPVWENGQHVSPCQAECPSGIPVQKRWDLIRRGQYQKALDIVLEYSPFPATVCGYLCPQPCMQRCTRRQQGLANPDVSLLGKQSIDANPPEPGKPSGIRVAIIGGGPAGISAAWQLWLKGHEPVIFETAKEPGGKITSVIPSERIPEEVIKDELKRIKERITHVSLDTPVDKEKFDQLRREFDFVIIATGAQKPRMLNVPGVERAMAALDFLALSKKNRAKVGKSVVIIGAGNVGCDVASEAARLGATDITLIDVQEPASFGEERKNAETKGAKFLWPRFTEAITDKGVKLATGEALRADTVIVSIGDQPVLDFITEDIESSRGFIKVDKNYRTSDPRVFAIGDTVKLGLLTDAIGAGRNAALAIDSQLKGKEQTFDIIPPIDTKRVKLEYYDPRVTSFCDINENANACASCGLCRDCGMCETICPENAITRVDLGDGEYEYVSDDDKCIGCGFCAYACPCGIWNLVENKPLDEMD